MWLYRAVSSEELADIVAHDEFRLDPNSMMGKWFAETPDNAWQWGQALYQNQGEDFHVIQVDVPSDIADQMFRLPMLDQIGPARYAEGDVLALINQGHQGIIGIPSPNLGGP